MRIGIPREIKPHEGRVALIPEAAGELVRAGNEVYLQAGAGEKSGYPDSAYGAQGVRIMSDAAALYGLLTLRVEVFVVEQQCPYPELDGYDLVDPADAEFARQPV